MEERRCTRRLVHAFKGVASPGDRHTCGKPDGEYCVYCLWYLTDGRPSRRAQVTAIKSWARLARVGGKSVGDELRVLEADLGYPALVRELPDGRLEMIDGVHRLAKAHRQKLDGIDVVVVTPAMLAAARI